ncbi:GNAT family N-acetyltransferase [Amnibacterium setariae]|uniref:GNAT family N-acetyltransferase n=1 Tax=Amnibacterium setariae TaxID=2306585 RepID=A0A3A1TZ45_9MICO|nr:GNAT family N-acetyltransferase [Amnibacterium setariae]RIX29985.1 GNAT family N-acetyltransferase [Amnibacterium setariae]
MDEDDRILLPAGAVLRPVGPDEWTVVAWLWQAFRQDLSPVVEGLPYADGRYGARPLERFPSADAVGHLVWRPHPNTGEQAPVGFALVDGLEGERRTITGFWIAPPLRRTGLGAAVALAVLGRHPGPWEIAFQHANPVAGAFWRRVADAAFGPDGWTETEEPVPGRPQAPSDHFIRSR